jgi:hypothetical protein
MTDAPERLYFYDDWLKQNVKGRLLCGNNEYVRADIHAAALADRDALRARVEMLDAALLQYESVAADYASDCAFASDAAYDWLCDDAGQTARAALKNDPATLAEIVKGVTG